MVNILSQIIVLTVSCYFLMYIYNLNIFKKSFRYVGDQEKANDSKGNLLDILYIFNVKATYHYEMTLFMLFNTFYMNAKD